MSSKMPPAASSPKKTASRGLGRGLSSLLGDSGIATATGATAPSSDAAGAPAATGFQDIPIEWINVGPWQPRRRFDKAGLDELASSIRQKGIVQPILLRPTPISHRVISLSQVNGAGGRHNWPKSIRCQRLFVS